LNNRTDSSFHAVCRIHLEIKVLNRGIGIRFTPSQLEGQGQWWEYKSSNKSNGDLFSCWEEKEKERRKEFDMNGIQTQICPAH